LKLTPLSSEESIFSNIDSLSPDFVPKILPFRENEQKEIALALQPLLNGVSARNLFIYGKAGMGKTHAVKRVLEELAEHGLLSIFVNCWTHAESENIIGTIAKQLNIIGDATLEKIKARLTMPCAFVFDEIDQAKSLDFLYAILEEIKVKAVVLISNKKDFIASVDERIRSRLFPEHIEFRDYKEDEIRAILAERRKYAFYEGTWHKEAVALLEEKTIERNDIRFGLALMKNSGLNAERDASRIVFRKHVEEALEKLP
jgi:cell division control protein 6